MDLAERMAFPEDGSAGPRSLRALKITCPCTPECSSNHCSPFEPSRRVQSRGQAYPRGYVIDLLPRRKQLS